MEPYKIQLNRQIYPLVAVKKAAYRFLDKCYIHMDMDSDYYLLSVKPKEQTTSIITEQIKNEVLAQSVRYDVYKQTHYIRELLLARAMSSTIIAEPIELPEDADAIGEDLDDILMDWFRKYEELYP